MQTIDECLMYWKMPRIPNPNRDIYEKKNENIAWRLAKFIKKNTTKIGNIYQLKERQFEETLNDLFHIAHSNAMNIFKIDEDKNFLLLQ